MSKYGNRKTIWKGITFDSKKEAEYARDLQLDPSVESVEYQVKYPVVVNGKKICVYIADFKVKFKDGSEQVIDVKPYDERKRKFYVTPLFLLKKKLVEALHHIDIILT